MKNKWIEPAKTAALVFLVVISFVQTGFLWFSSAPTRTMDPFETGTMPPYIFNDGNYNRKLPWQLASPYQLIVHKNGTHFRLHPESDAYQSLTSFLRTASLEDIRSISKPNAEAWKKLFFQTTGVELVYPRDLPVSELDAFFLETIRHNQEVRRLTTVSRVWFFEDPAAGKTFIWFVSDSRQLIVQAEVELKDKSLSAEVAKASGIPLAAVQTGEHPPWDPAADKQPFSRVLYLPEKEIPVPRLVFPLSAIRIDDMKSWLFTGHDEEPINLKPGEHVYISNEKMLTWNENGRFITYHDTSVRPDHASTTSASGDLDTINGFIQRHRGWTGNWLLDETEPTESRITEYRFRLFVRGFPVYWDAPGTDGITPDVMLLSAGSGEVGRYSRSLLYLRDNPQESESRLPGKQEILNRLSSEKVPLSSILQILPAYFAKPSSDGKRVTLEPTWVVFTEHREPLFITSR
ncbi:two-component system activity regulator YycH [Staphylospora marina]|uniref:two-component system activity regulator YycH n=1 Tax=Staphylospora marina TaxID=2490858 RepID=UPI000F5B9ED3|nr:two-component system activity regulator YycH [Staphylospora marina]